MDSSRRPLPLIHDLKNFDANILLADWRWRLPPRQTPLFVTLLADWVFGAPDGSLWRLDSLEGDYEQIARNSAEYNERNRSTEWVYETFQGDWYGIAVGNGLIPNLSECIGWKVHPLLGGKFEVGNLQLFSANVYHSLMGQLHRQVRLPPSGQ